MSAVDDLEIETGYDMQLADGVGKSGEHSGKTSQWT